MNTLGKNRLAHVCLTLIVLFVSMLPSGFAQAAGTDSGVQGLQRIGEQTDPSKPAADKLVLAVIGDYGDCAHYCGHEQAVADLVHSWNPSAILTTGDNSYRLGTADEVEADQKPYWDDIAAGRFFPIYGNHDYGNGCSPDSIKPSLDYFHIPVSYVAGFGNGLVDFINPDANCNMSSDTGTPPKINDAYQKTVADSTAKWVMSGGHQPIFSSGQAGNNLNRRWLLTPGVDLLLQGHDHHAEHVVTPEGYNEVISGNGGQGLTPLFPPVPGSEFRDNKNYGAVRLTITPETMTVDFVNLSGTVDYSFTLKKDPFTKKAYIASHTEWVDPNPLPPGEQLAGDRTVSMAFGEDNEYKNGLDWIPYESGLAHEVQMDGRTVLQIDRSPFGTGNNLYMQIQDERIFSGPYKATASLEYRSPVAGSFVLQYESAATGAAYFSTQRVTIAPDQVDKWQTVTLDMPSAMFTNRQNGGADMRIVAANKLPLLIGSIKIDATPDKLPVSLWAIRIQNIDPMKAGDTSQTAVSGVYSDFSKAAITAGVTFTSSNEAVAAVESNSGLITARNPGDTVITATYGGLTDQFHLVVRDTSPPSTAISQAGTVLNDGNYVGKTTVQLTATDDYAGVDKIEYSLDGGNTWTSYSHAFDITHTDGNILQFRATDKAGNVEAAHSQSIQVKEASIANLESYVTKDPAHAEGMSKSLLNRMEQAKHQFEAASALHKYGKTELAQRFEASGYETLGKLRAQIQRSTAKQLDRSVQQILLLFLNYMIDNKTPSVTETSPYETQILEKLAMVGR